MYHKKVTPTEHQLELRNFLLLHGIPILLRDVLLARRWNPKLTHVSLALLKINLIISLLVADGMLCGGWIVVWSLQWCKSLANQSAVSQTPCMWSTAWHGLYHTWSEYEKRRRVLQRWIQPGWTEEGQVKSCSHGEAAIQHHTQAAAIHLFHSVLFLLKMGIHILSFTGCVKFTDWSDQIIIQKSEIWYESVPKINLERHWRMMKKQMCSTDITGRGNSFDACNLCLVNQQSEFAGTLMRAFLLRIQQHCYGCRHSMTVKSYRNWATWCSWEMSCRVTDLKGHLRKRQYCIPTGTMSCKSEESSRQTIFITF